MTYAENDNTPAPGSPKSICIAEVMTAHGIRGLVKLRCHLEDPQELKDYNPLKSADGKEWTVVLKNRVKTDWVAEIKGIDDRNDAEKLRGLKFYITRDALPAPAENEFYHDDLIGCRAMTAQGTTAGVVIGVSNFGAGDLIEIQPLEGQSYYLPIAKPFVQKIDPIARLIIVEPHEEFMNE